ncbi:MAG: Holliday junction resolvase RuvX [Burkholderiales bacterium]|nr:Holliday junction resolvase RuvX [Burkholderiales bacterium]
MSPGRGTHEGAPAPSASAAVSPRFQTFLAFDFGLPPPAGLRQPVAGHGPAAATIQAEGDARFAPVARAIAEWQPDALVVGVPYHPDGASHDNTRRAQRFARQLRGRFGLPVFEVDERYSTTEALATDARDADAASACIILEQFLRSLS